MTEVLINAIQLFPQTSCQPTPVGSDLKIVTDTVYGFIGPDSACISSWLQTLAVIAPPAQGQVLFRQQPTHHTNRSQWQQLRLNIAYLNQHSALMSALVTQENILLPALYHQLDTRPSLLEKMTALLARIGYANLDSLTELPAYIDELAYSQAILIRAVLTRPAVIIIDNTFRHFDERTSRKLLAFLKAYAAESHAALLIHDDDSQFVMSSVDKIVYADEHGLEEFMSRNEMQASTRPHVLQYLRDFASW